MDQLPTAAVISTTEIALIFLVIALGLFWFVGIARREQSTSWKLSTFFLGGGTIGPQMTEQNTLGITFAWASATWVWVTLGYQCGPWVVLMQLPWCISLLALAGLFRRIRPVTKNRTIHGFLGERYGADVQLVAACATTLGYVFLAGFELNWAAWMFAHSLGRPDLKIPFALALALITAAYCSISGYRGNVRTDKWQNILGVLALALLLICVAGQLHLGQTLNIAVGIFTIASISYIGVTLFLNRTSLLQADTTQTVLAIVFGVIACLVAIFLPWFSAPLGSLPSVSSLVGNAPMSLPLFVGLVTLMSFFNVIDMANWQQIASNAEVDPEKYGEVQRSIVRGSIYILWFPTLGGVLLGCAMRQVSGTLDQNTIFTDIFALVLPGGNEVIRGLILGILFLGFIATSLSTVDNFIMSAAQTSVYDIFLTKPINQLLGISETLATPFRSFWLRLRKRLFGEPHHTWDEKSVVERARMYLMPLALVMVLGFWVLWEAYPDDILNFQGLMYSFALPLFCPIILALFLPPRAALRSSRGVFWGFWAVFAEVISMFIIAITLPQGHEAKDWLLNLMPATAFLTSFVAYFIGWWLLPPRSTSPD